MDMDRGASKEDLVGQRLKGYEQFSLSIYLKSHD